MKNSKNNGLNYLIAILTILLANNLLFAQEKESAKPLELPAFIIEGVEQHNLKSSIKQMPARPSVLNSSELDSLNTFEKQQPTLLAADKLPTHYVTKPYKKGFLQASYGLFNTPELAAGYGFYLDRFDIFANAGFSLSNGDALNSEHNKFFLDINSNYIADEKFFIFGGSSTKTGILINSQNYNFYGYERRPENTNYYDRNLTQAKFHVVSDGTFENVIFSVGGNANIIQTNNNSKAAKYVVGADLNNYFANGFLTVKNYWNNFLLAGNINLNFEDVAGNSLNYYQFDGSASYFDENFSILAKAGFQIANNSANISRGGLLLLGNIEYRMNRLFTIKAEVSSGLEKTNFEELISYNPYLSPNIFIDHSYNIANIKGVLWFHPNEKIAINAGIDLRYADRNLIFTEDTLAEFKLEYLDGTVNDIFGEILWNITTYDKLTGRLNLNINNISDGNLTYIPPFKLNGTYHRKWFDNALGTFVSLDFVGSKYTSISEKKQLDSYFVLNLGADYSIKNFNIFLKLNNLTNSDIYFWDNYKERGLFCSLGLLWQF
jgi:hypothetical protein